MNPLKDPILEAAAQILAKWAGGSVGIKGARNMSTTYPVDACAMIEEAARQIDNLRAIGALPQGEKSAISVEASSA